MEVYFKIVRYKLNRSETPQVNQFDVRALLFGGYSGFIPLFKMVYIDDRNLSSGILSMSQSALTLFPSCNGLLLWSF